MFNCHSNSINSSRDLLKDDYGKIKCFHMSIGFKRKGGGEGIGGVNGLAGDGILSSAICFFMFSKIKLWDFVTENIQRTRHGKLKVIDDI